MHNNSKNIVKNILSVQRHARLCQQIVLKKINIQSLFQKSKPLVTLLILLLFSGLLIPANGQCDNSQRRDAYKLLNGATYLRDLKIDLPESRSKKPATEEKPFMMNKGSRYRFAVVADPTKSGIPIVRIFDQFKDYVVADKGTSSNVFDFICNKTQIYTISVHFQEGKDGCCIFMMAMVEQ